uniref:PDZ domain-containing protein n=1 Tax=Ditylenchus dipsaci TaxID=166011 RepID=A0A915DYD1_9BILA
MEYSRFWYHSGCKYYIKEITNPRLAEKEPGLKEGDTVLRVNGQTLEGVTLEEAARLLHRSREKLSLVVQRDVRRGSAGSSGLVKPRHSPTPVHYTHSASNSTGTANASSLHQTESAGIPPASSSLQHNSRKFSADYSPGPKRFSDPMGSSNYQAQIANHNNSPQPFPQSNFYNSNNGGNSYLRQGQSPQMYNQQQQQGFNSNNYPAQTHTPSSSIISASSATNSPRNFAASTGSNSTAMANYAYYNQQLPQHPQQLQQQRDIRQVGFKKGAGGLGIRVIGGNQVGIFVSAVQEDSPAAQNGIKVGDRLHAVNNQNINGATREQAVDYLLALGDEVNLRVESSHNQDEFSHINGGQLGDSFYIRRNQLANKKSPSKDSLTSELANAKTRQYTLLGGKAGYWQVTKVYSVNESDSKGSHAGDMANGGIIPNSKTASLAKQARMDSSTLGRSIFRKRLQSRRTNCWRGNPPFTDIPLPAYERVALKKPAFHRPVVIYGPLADVARQLLLSNFGQRFGAAIVDNYMLQTTTNSNQGTDHPISPGSVERLQLAQYAPIVVLIDVDSRNRIRDLRSKSGATTLSAKKLMEQGVQNQKTPCPSTHR